MRLPHLLIFFGCSAIPALTRKISPDPAVARENAPQVFNAVHSAMRQWGSSVYHNGMSIFLVTIPQGNLFYHGCATSERRSGFEWLGFEPEQSEFFARSQEAVDLPDDSLISRQDVSQGVFRSYIHASGHNLARRGYLHTYKAARDLRLLLPDGQSAAKGFGGTLDTQDLVLIMDTKLPDGFVEYERAKALCKLAKAHNLDGIIRLEAGFEIIYCAFEDGGGLDLVSIVGSPFSNETTGETAANEFETLRAATQRYHGFEADRVLVDYSSMVSAFWYPINRTNPDTLRPDMPRLINTTREERQVLLDRVLEVSAARPTGSVPVHWQAVADRIVNLLERRLAVLADPKSTPRVMRRLLDSLLTQFIDYGQPTSPEDAVSACAYRHLDRPLESKPSWTPEDNLIFESFTTVTHRICTSLFALRAALDVPAEDLSLNLTTERAIISDLMSWLGWTKWRGCGGQPCQDHNKICLIPMFSTGTVEDHWHPRCKNETETMNSVGYFSCEGQRPGACFP